MIAPAFDSRKQALAFALLLLGLLLLPLITGAFGVFSRADVYSAMLEQSGAFSYMRQQIFEERSDLDMVFVGSSFLWVGVDTPYVQKELSRQLSREARVITLGSKFPGEDRTFFVLRDLLQHRKVKVVVLNMVDIDLMRDEPHPQAYRFFRVGEDEKFAASLPVRYQIPLYADACLGIPRHLLSVVRSNLTADSPYAPDLGAWKVRAGYAGMGSPFEPFSPPLLEHPPQALVYSVTARTNFSFSGAKLNAYQTHFVEQMGQLLGQQGVRLVILHVPRNWEERRDPVVKEITYWPDVFGMPAALVGVPPAQLFAGLSDNEVKKLYYNNHLNENGNVFFTRAVTPALLQIYAETRNR